MARNMTMVAEGADIYTMRNPMCSAHPGATVIIKDVESGTALKSESRYRAPLKT